MAFKNFGTDGQTLPYGQDFCVIWVGSSSPDCVDFVRLEFDLFKKLWVGFLQLDLTHVVGQIYKCSFPTIAKSAVHFVNGICIFCILFEVGLWDQICVNQINEVN